MMAQLIGWVSVVVFNATFNNISVISWRLVLLVMETRVPGENHWPAASHWQTLSYNIIGFELTTSVVIGTDCRDSCKSNYHTTITALSQVHRNIKDKIDGNIIYRKLIVCNIHAIDIMALMIRMIYPVTEILLKVALNTITITLLIRNWGIHKHIQYTET